MKRAGERIEDTGVKEREGEGPHANSRPVASIGYSEGLRGTWRTPGANHAPTASRTLAPCGLAGHDRAGQGA